MAQHNELGKWGEDAATRFLKQQGYIVCERNWRQGRRDLDIIALTEDHCTMVFVEVKTRQADDVEEPEQAVDQKKIRNLALAANAYVKAHDTPQELRFDIISVVGIPPGEPQVRHIVDAFNPLLL